MGRYVSRSWAGRFGERARPVCRFGRRARTLVGQISWLTGFRRDAENGNRDGCAPYSECAWATDSFPVFILGWTSGIKMEFVWTAILARRKFESMKSPSRTLLSYKVNMESGRAIIECMIALHPARTESLKAEANFIPDDPPCGRGSVFVTLHWPNFTGFPKVICETDMRGFGILHNSFNPDFDIFTFEKEGMKLCVVSGEYRFALLGIRLV